ncbi:MAG: hypothetical protein WC620_05260 [Methanoregula sp.]|jgi:hypothetical protein
MDDLVLTGTLSLIAFFAVIIAGILAVLFFFSPGCGVQRVQGITTASL